MADAVVARWHGDNYQARVFWENASIFCCRTPASSR